MLKILILTMTLSLFSSTSFAEDIAAGESKSVTCKACHGANGISMNSLWPNLAGQQKAYLLKQLKAFKDGTRKDPIMSPLSQVLSDKDMVNISAYFNSLKETK